MTITKPQRWLDLIAFLVKRRFPVSVEEIMEGVPAYAEKWRTEDQTARATVRRMFERDKDELRAADIPLETVDHTIEHGAEQTQGYRLAGRDFYLPYLRIVGGQATDGTRAPAGAMEVAVSTEEAQLAMDALQRVADLPGSPFAAEARSALAKLRFDLLPAAPADTAPERPALLEPAPVLFADAMGTGGVGALLRLLGDALRNRRRVRFSYHGIRRGETTERDVAPYGLLYQRGHWYLIGHDATRDAIRVFRLGRIEDAEPGPDNEYDYDPDFSLSAYAGREPWELGDDAPLAADVRFEFPLSLWAERNAHGEEVERRAGGAVVRRFEVRQTDPFLRWLQSFAGDAVVEEPAALRRAQAALARETMALYADPHAG